MQIDIRHRFEGVRREDVEEFYLLDDEFSNEERATPRSPTPRASVSRYR
ncbi:MAG: hypothetical protein M3Y87_17725 [Myxococcota bacterium]|nr:hypothetical protein [Myxococcota bacterium]